MMDKTMGLRIISQSLYNCSTTRHITENTILWSDAGDFGKALERRKVAYN
ncbi:hypothetical protein [Desulfosarcina ovata]|nr:hypothetical protein [Desulfosarcina ovata]